MYTKLRSIRKQKDIPVTSILDALGLETLAAYYKKETGLVKFTLEEAKKISELFGLSIDEVFFEDKLSLEDKIREGGA